MGSYVGYKLATMGHQVLVIEQKQIIGEQVCCTGIISQECVSSFAIDSKVILSQANSAQLFSPSSRLISLRRQEPQAYIIDRTAFDMSMATQAQDKGAEYLLGSPARNIDIGDDRVRIEMVRHNKELNLEAKVVVIAAGFGANLTDRFGVGKASDFVMGAQAEVRTIGADEVEVYFGHQIAPGFFAWLVPTSPETALVGLLSRRSPDLYLNNLLTSLLTQKKIASTSVEVSYGGIPLKPLSRTYGDRLIVVGDAAGQVKPTTGGGIYYGLLCADIAAKTLHQALESDDLSAKSLAKYERLWKKKLGRELKIDYYARKVYEQLNDWQIDRVFDIILSNGIDEALLKTEDLSFDWHSMVVLKLMKHAAVSKALGIMKLPPWLTGLKDRRSNN